MVPSWCLLLTYEDDQAGPLIGPLLVTCHLFVGQEVGVSGGLGSLARRALPVLPAQTEAPPETGCGAAAAIIENTGSGGQWLLLPDVGLSLVHVLALLMLKQVFV